MTSQDLIIKIADYAYRKANPQDKMDTPSIVYEQVEKDFTPFVNSLINQLKYKIITELHQKKKDIDISKGVSLSIGEIRNGYTKKEKVASIQAYNRAVDEIIAIIKGER